MGRRKEAGLRNYHLNFPSMHAASLNFMFGNEGPARVERFSPFLGYKYRGLCSSCSGLCVPHISETDTKVSVYRYGKISPYVG